jgi:predicted restriction endonuclease
MVRIIPDFESRLNRFLDTQIENEGFYGKVRPGQQKYRKALFKLWDGVCAVSSCDQPEMLVASHIKPFAECAAAEAYDPYNGFLLSADWDRLFDKFLISFDNNGEILYTNRVMPFVRRVWWKRVTSSKLVLFPKNLPYLAYHREHCGFEE